MNVTTTNKTIVLVGFESVGKSAIFRALTGKAVGDEANFRGSTIRVRSAKLSNSSIQLVDTPGIRVHDDAETTRITLQHVNCADIIVLVVRGTHIKAEIELLMQEVYSTLQDRKLALIITFRDKVSPEIYQLISKYKHILNIPIAFVNARNLQTSQYNEIMEAIKNADLVRTKKSYKEIPDIPVVNPQRTLFENRLVGPWLSILVIALLFAAPVYLAYIFADWLQPYVDQIIITPLVSQFDWLIISMPLIHSILVGDFGIITLGWYSFLWAFPVVFLIAISVAVTEEIGLKDRITASLDPWLRQIGLNGRDLIPLLSGFGCNVVAVYQTRSCSTCTRKACISVITFGAACSYQIGASLSLFNSAEQPWLFAPYLILLFVVGSIHTRIWHQTLTESATTRISDRAFLQFPSLRGIVWRIRAVLKKFLLEAMPIFIIICVVGAISKHLGILDGLGYVVAPLLNIFGLPVDIASGVIFSIVRKDGLLILNQGQGELLNTLSTSQIFVLVYLSSTITACLVTLWAIRKEFGVRHAFVLGSRQVLTSLITTFIIASVLYWFPL